MNDYTPKVGDRVEYPSGKGKVLIAEHDVNKTIVVLDDIDGHKLVAASVVKRELDERFKWGDKASWLWLKYEGEAGAYEFIYDAIKSGELPNPSSQVKPITYEEFEKHLRFDCFPSLEFTYEDVFNLLVENGYIIKDVKL